MQGGFAETQRHPEKWAQTLTQTKRPRNPGPAHQPRIQARVSTSYGLSSHPETRPATAIGRRGIFIYTLGQGWVLSFL